MEDDGGAESAMAEGFAPCRLQLEQTLCSNTNTEDETSIGAGAKNTWRNSIYNICLSSG